ncbi:MAG: VWA domain-containing protein [Pseudomonadota bacterium]
MEEQVGALWHRLITRAARRDHPAAAVELAEVRLPAALLFRALGGAPGLQVKPATETTHGARRPLLERIAGQGRRVELAWRDAETLRLPARLAWFAERDLNRDLYLWLAALAAMPQAAGGDWLQRNAAATAAVLARCPGLCPRYRRLVQAHLADRPAADGMGAAEAARERALRAALEHPDVRAAPLPAASTAPAPVPLWLHPAPPVSNTPRSAPDDPEDAEATGGDSTDVENAKRRRGERVDAPKGRGGLLAFRLESLFTRAEYASVDRSTEESADPDARAALEDLDVLSLARARKRTAARLRFDLDLPPEAHDDIRLGAGIALPEWDYRHGRLLDAHCRLQPMLARDAPPQPLPVHLRQHARRLRALFEHLKPARVWQHDQPDGCELDINAVIAHAAERLQGREPDDAGLFRDLRNGARDLSCLLLADLSLSTDAFISDRQRVIDVIRDSLFLFSEALAATGDRCALYGFSSRHRSHVRFHTLKAFTEPHSDTVRGRINALRPGYYTRMGAAIRHATHLLQKEPSADRLLLLLTDGKPNDLDHYEGRYGIEDTRHAIQTAQRCGVRPFCVTIDRKAREYLPYLFGSNGWMLVRNAGELPGKLPQLYARLTG